MPTIIELVQDRSDRISPETSLREVVSRMLERGISSVIVVDGGIAVGIITERDLLRVMRRRGSPDQAACETMSRPVHSVTADTDFRKAYREASSLGFRRIVVTDANGLPLGIVSETDFRKYLGPDFFMQLNSVDTLMDTSFPRLPQDAALSDALTAMEAIRGSCTIVVDGRKPLGIVTEHDIVRTFPSGETASPLSAVMTSPTINVCFDQPLNEAAQLMLDHRIRHLAVVDHNGNLVGLLSEHALMTPLRHELDKAINERLHAEERQRLAASVFDNAREGIMITDQSGRIVEVNGTFTELTGYSRAEAVGQTPDLLKSGHHDAAFYSEMWQKIEQDGYWQGEIWNRRKSGEIFVEQLTISVVRDPSGQASHYVAIFSDITLIKQHQQRLEHLAHFDALTQLPNRMLLGDRMQLAMAQTERSGKMLAVCYLDLDNFKPINDEFGHSVGDYLLISVAQRLKTCVRAGDTVARLGGDEFVLLITDIGDLHECEHAMARIITTLTQPFRVSQRQVSISASIGVTLYPHDGADSDTLLRHADQAMYAAKQAGRNRHHLFDPENDRRARIRREEIGRIREALAKDEFRLYFQPKVDMRKGTVIGAEALIRWQHPERGILLPATFLPVVEGTETAIELGDWVINETLRQLDAWFAEHDIRVSVSINIGGNHLQHPGFSRRLGELLDRYPKVSPEQVELEILETAALEDVGTTAALFTECRDLGVSFALDDFGTGYSSLTYFRRLPADTLKIDQSFVRDMLDNPDDLAIVEGVIGLTQAFRCSVIAEGVETVEHGLVLLLLGCDMAQGFGIARPMPADELPGWIANFQPDELWNLGAAFNWSREDLPMLIAEVDHSRWTRSLHAYLDDATGSSFPPPLDPVTCRFACWYSSADSQRYAHIEAFRKIPATHARVHAIGAQLVNKHQAGDTNDVDVLRQEFRTCTAELNERIQQTQAEVLISAQARRR